MYQGAKTFYDKGLPVSRVDYICVARRYFEQGNIKYCRPQVKDGWDLSNFDTALLKDHVPMLMQLPRSPKTWDAKLTARALRWSSNKLHDCLMTGWMRGEFLAEVDAQLELAGDEFRNAKRQHNSTAMMGTLVNAVQKAGAKFFLTT